MRISGSTALASLPPISDLPSPIFRRSRHFEVISRPPTTDGRPPGAPKPAPTVSIIMPAYRAAAYLPETLASVGAQTRLDWELIVVEDASNDGTEGIVQAFAQAHPQNRVAYLRHDTNSGEGAARNTAIREASGDWLAFLDSDDLWQPDHLALCLTKAREECSDLVYADFAMFDDDPARPFEVCRYGLEAWGGKFPANLYVHNFIQPSAALVSRDAVLAVGGFCDDHELRGTADIDLWFRLAGAGFLFAHVDRPTLLYRKHAQAATSSTRRIAAAKAHAWFKNRDTVTKVPRSFRRLRVATVCAEAARDNRSLDPAVAARLYWMAWRAMPSRLTRLAGAAVCLATAALKPRPNRSS